MSVSALMVWRWVLVSAMDQDAFLLANLVIWVAVVQHVVHREIWSLKLINAFVWMGITWNRLNVINAHTLVKPAKILLDNASPAIHHNLEK